MRHGPTHRHLLTRRGLLAGLGAGVLALPLPAFAQPVTDGAEFGLTPDGAGDQTESLQTAIDTAAERGQTLQLAGGRYIAGGIHLPSRASLAGVPGATEIALAGNGPLVEAENQKDISVTGITFSGPGMTGAGEDLVVFHQCSGLALSGLSFALGPATGLRVEASAGRVADCDFAAFGGSALHAQDSAGLVIARNVISDCGNGGIRVWRHEPGADGTIVTENRISGIGSQSGNGQNGNGINAFNADEVIIADNAISDCDFSAVRVNTTRNAVIRGNTCTGCREVAIFSEFAFTGSIIANNIVDDAALGISVTNSNEGGRLAVVSGNIVRNILKASPTNPDTSPAGIFAEADTAITGNVVENVPGPGILAGWGPYLENVLVGGNIVGDARIGIGVSVADGAGAARIAGNMIHRAEEIAIGGFAWREQVGSDLADNPDQFAHLTIEGNTVSAPR